MPRRWNDQPFVECASCGWRRDLRVFKCTDPQGAEHTMCPECAGVDYLPARRRVFCSSLCDVFDNQVPIAWPVDVLRWWMETPNRQSAP